MSEWWYSDRTGEVGPLSLSEVVETLGTFSTQQLETVLVWREGFEEWKSIRHAPELGLPAVLSEAEHLESRSPPGAQLRADLNEAPSSRATARTLSKLLLIGSVVGALAAVVVMMMPALREPSLEEEAERAVRAGLTEPESARLQGARNEQAMGPCMRVRKSKEQNGRVCGL
ncbi:DUF4339 domain-containing protein [Bradyrhizobium ottawaense]|uniref:DUF4339 domain-containing protein n=1 Tax=Bradyrhizobium ottawaense TaxID=931866 RepID=UPI003FA10C79